MKGELKDKNAVIVKLEEQITSLKSELNGMVIERQKMQQEMESFQKRLKEAEQLLKRRQNENEVARGLLQEVRSQADASEARAREILSKTAELKSDLEEMREQLNVKQRDITKRDKMIRKRNRRLVKLAARRDELSNGLKEKERLLNEKTKLLKLAQDELEDMKSNMENGLNELRHNLETLSGELAVRESEIKDRDFQLEALRQRARSGVDGEVQQQLMSKDRQKLELAEKALRESKARENLLHQKIAELMKFHEEQVADLQLSRAQLEEKEKAIQQKAFETFAWGTIKKMDERNATDQISTTVDRDTEIEMKKLHTINVTTDQIRKKSLISKDKEIFTWEQMDGGANLEGRELVKQGIKESVTGLLGEALGAWAGNWGLLAASYFITPSSATTTSYSFL